MKKNIFGILLLVSLFSGLFLSFSARCEAKSIKEEPISESTSTEYLPSEEYYGAFDQDNTRTQVLVLDVGETATLFDEQGEKLYIRCTKRVDVVTRGRWHCTNQSFDIYISYNSIVVTVDISCNWYEQGMDGYIKDLTATYTKKNILYSCSWNDNFKITAPHSHTVCLDIISAAGNSFNKLFTATYNPFQETLNIGCY